MCDVSSKNCKTEPITQPNSTFVRDEKSAYLKFESVGVPEFHPFHRARIKSTSQVSVL